MPKFVCDVVCPNCSEKSKLTTIFLKVPSSFGSRCPFCYFPYTCKTGDKRLEMRVEKIRKKAFLIHSASAEDKKLLEWLRELLKLYGVATTIIEEDPRPIGWLQKSLDGITSADFVLAFLTKRHQFMDKSGQVAGWKAPDKCYDEVAIAFALGKDLFALVEKEVDSGRVLETRAWCFQFERDSPIKAGCGFFKRLDFYLHGE